MIDPMSFALGASVALIATVFVIVVLFQMGE
jgi:hypothetical protein